jgi:hypothetical protein
MLIEEKILIVCSQEDVACSLLGLVSLEGFNRAAGRFGLAYKPWKTNHIQVQDVNQQQHKIEQAFNLFDQVKHPDDEFGRIKVMDFIRFVLPKGYEPQLDARGEQHIEWLQPVATERMTLSDVNNGEDDPQGGCELEDAGDGDVDVDAGDDDDDDGDNADDKETEASKGDAWVDDDFPPSQKSLGGELSKAGDKVWKPAKDLGITKVRRGQHVWRCICAYIRHTPHTIHTTSTDPSPHTCHTPFSYLVAVLMTRQSSRPTYSKDGWVTAGCFLSYLVWQSFLGSYRSSSKQTRTKKPLHGRPSRAGILCSCSAERSVGLCM